MTCMRHLDGNRDGKGRGHVSREGGASGIFRIRNVSDAEMGPLLVIGSANILFPYVRETVLDSVARGGFPTGMLDPVNFKAHYQ